MHWASPRNDRGWRSGQASRVGWPVNPRQPVHREAADPLNALGFSLPAGQRREREPCPAPPWGATSRSLSARPSPRATSTRTANAQRFQAHKRPRPRDVMCEALLTAHPFVLRKEVDLAPHGEPFTNPFAGLSAGRVRSARTVPKMRTPANPVGCGRRAGTLSLIRTVPSRVEWPARPAPSGQRAVTWAPTTAVPACAPHHTLPLLR
jgi:hypothetical protein